MASVLMNLISAFFIFHPATECCPLPESAVAQTESAEVQAASEYMVIERVDNDMAWIEGERGSFAIPMQMLPIGAREGTVIEWHTDAAETQRRLASAQERLSRMRHHDAVEI